MSFEISTYSFFITGLRLLLKCDSTSAIVVTQSSQSACEAALWYKSLHKGVNLLPSYSQKTIFQRAIRPPFSI